MQKPRLEEKAPKSLHHIYIIYITKTLVFNKHKGKGRRKKGREGKGKEGKKPYHIMQQGEGTKLLSKEEKKGGK